MRGDPDECVQIAVADDDLDILGEALVAMVDRRQPADDGQWDALLARESRQRRKGFGELRFLRFVALHGGDDPFEVEQCVSGMNDCCRHR
jgi:hypothetical protein